MRPFHRQTTLAARAVVLLALLSAALVPPAMAADPTAAPAQAAASSATGYDVRSSSLPARGLFEGDRLSASARARLDELIVDAAGLQVEVALVTPVGPWSVGRRGDDERRLTPARLAAIKRYLAERGVDSRRIYVESRIDARLADARLDVQVGGRPAQD